jgi:AbrB family looped-hinge helix DNA binding protein
LEVRRKVGQKGQIVIPKIIREFLTIRPVDEVIQEVKGKKLLLNLRSIRRSLLKISAPLVVESWVKNSIWKNFWEKRLGESLLTLI